MPPTLGEDVQAGPPRGNEVSESSGPDGTAIAAPTGTAQVRQRRYGLGDTSVHRLGRTARIGRGGRGGRPVHEPLPPPTARPPPAPRPDHEHRGPQAPPC